MDTSEHDLGVDVQFTVNFKAIEVSMSVLRELVTTVCSCFGPDIDRDVKYQISIAIVGDAEIEDLNTRFLNHAGTTDCLSFDLSESGEKSRIFDVIVNGEMALRQADSRGHSGQAELALYIVHGLLHNLGFDDSTPALARKMHETEDDILQQIGYGFVYNRKSTTPEQ